MWGSAPRESPFSGSGPAAPSQGDFTSRLLPRIAPRSMRSIAPRSRRAGPTTARPACGLTITRTTTALLCSIRTATTSRRSVTGRLDGPHEPGRRSCRPQQARLHFQHRGCKAVAVGHHLAHDRKRGRARRLDLADDAAEIERQLGVELAGELLHAPVLGETGHVQELDAAVARGEQRAVEQRRADPVALPGLFDAEGGLRLL